MFPGGKSGWCVRLTNFPPTRADCHEIWSLNLLQPPGPVQTWNGIALPFYNCAYFLCFVSDAVLWSLRER